MCGRHRFGLLSGLRQSSGLGRSRNRGSPCAQSEPGEGAVVPVEIEEPPAVELSEEERQSLLRTLRWVMIATQTDKRGEEMMQDIIDRLERAPAAVAPKL